MTIIQRSVLLVLLFSGFINAALIEQNNAHAIGGTVGHGGWFTWTGSRLDTISIVPGENSTWDLKLYDGRVTCNNPGGEFYTQAGINVNAVAFTPGDQSSSFQTIPLTTPQNLTTGNIYTFCFYENGGDNIVFFGWNDETPDPYLEGGLSNQWGSFDGNSGTDVAFQLDGMAAISVPLLSPFGYLLLTVLMGFFGYRKLKA